MARLAALATSSIGICDYSPRRRCHHARTLSDRHSCLQDAAVGHLLSPSTTQGSRGEYLMVMTTPLLMLGTADSHHAPPPKARRRRQRSRGRSPPAYRRVQPGTKGSRSSSFGDPTKYRQTLWPLLHGSVARDDAAIKATPSAQCYGRVSP